MSSLLSSQLVKRSIKASDILRSVRAVMESDQDAHEVGEKSWMTWASGASVAESDYPTSSGRSRATLLHATFPRCPPSCSREALAASRVTHQLINFSPAPSDLRLHLNRISAAAKANHQSGKWKSDEADHDLLTASWSMTVEEPAMFDHGSTGEEVATADRENIAVTAGENIGGQK